MYCNNCGKELPENSKFCNYCGASQQIADVKHNEEEIQPQFDEKSAVKKDSIQNYAKIFFVIAPFISLVFLFCTIVTVSTIIRFIAILILIITAILWCVSCYLSRKNLKEKVGNKSMKWLLNNLWTVIAGFLVVGCFLLSFTTGDSAEPTNENTDNSVATTTVVTTTEPTTEAPIEITAIKLIKEYQNNEIAFEKKYVGKTLRVSGVIDDISSSYGSNYISISDGNGWVNVDCYLRYSEEDKAAEYNTGDYITIIGKCTGESWGEPQLSSCEIIK